MRWCGKSLLGFCLAILFLNGALLFLSRGVFLKSFVRLENRRAHETMRRGVNVYVENLEFLTRLTRDWAHWDDAYHFMQSRERDFLDSNIVDSTFANLNLNVILFFDETGNIVAGKAFDLQRQSAVPLYSDLPRALTADSAGTSLLTKPGGLTGLLCLQEGHLMVAIQPILSGEGQGPARGTLLMGRFLDDIELGRFGAKADLPFEFSKLHSGRQWPDWGAVSTDEPEILLRVVDKKTMRSRILLRDVRGRPAVVIATTLQRQIYAQGLRAMTYFHVWMLLVSTLAGGGIWFARDRLIGSRQKQWESESLFQHLFECSADAFFLCDANGRFVDVNQEACRLLGYDRHDLLGLAWNDITDAAMGDLLARAHDLPQVPAAPLEAMFKGLHGACFPGDINVSRLELQERIFLFVLVRDISERKTAENMLQEQKTRLNYLAYHDVLTGLPNRLKSIEMLQVFIARARHRDTVVAALLLDIDRFKNINESLGHEIGDEILMEVSRRIKGLLRDTDEVARFGGDEFLVLMEPGEEGEGITTVAEKLLEAIARPLDIRQQQFYLTGSVGIGLFPRHGEDAQGIIKAADSAMHFAKEQGRNTYRFFIPSLNVAVEDRLYLENDLRRALEKRQFMLYYQPQFDLQSGRVECLEALLRWQHPERGVIGPGEFIPLAEDTGLIVPIGEWVMEEACSQLVDWQHRGLPSLRVAVNISARQFRQAGFVETVFRILHQKGLSAHWLELEITESIVIQGAGFARNMFKVLREAGIRLAIDDFGLGYSSLSYLKNFPFSKLKMDRAFVKNVVNDTNDRAIAAAIIALGKTLGMEVVAEGVEGKEQLDILRDLGCPSGQGFYLTLPMSPEKTAIFLNGGDGGQLPLVKAFRV